MTILISDPAWHGLMQAAGENWNTPWDEYRILADWYEEQGDLDAAECLRWMAWRKRRPYKTGVGVPPYRTAVYWWWCDLSRCTAGYDDVHARSALPESLEFDYDLYKTSYAEAILGVVEKWRRLKQEDPAIITKLLNGDL